MSRQAGWYWVKEEGCPSWVVAEHSQEQEAEWVDNSGRELYWVAEVGPRIPTPDEPWQCVPTAPTLEMQKAYFDSIDENMQRVQTDLRFGRFDNQRIGYQRMLAAAPKPGGA